MIFEPISSWNSFFATVFLWILLAGFLILPSTFPNFETIVQNATKNSTVNQVLHSVHNHALYVPYFFLHLAKMRLFLLFIRFYADLWDSIYRIIIAFTCCGIGTFGLCILWIRMRHNCVWLLNSIFIPGMFNGLSGLISTFVGIYGSQTGVSYGTTTIATLAATGGCAVICSGLGLIYWFKKRRVVRDHERENEK
jgi:hypothetical protein